MLRKWVHGFPGATRTLPDAMVPRRRAGRLHARAGRQGRRGGCEFRSGRIWPNLRLQAPASCMAFYSAPDGKVEELW